LKFEVSSLPGSAGFYALEVLVELHLIPLKFSGEDLWEWLKAIRNNV